MTNKYKHIKRHYDCFNDIIETIDNKKPAFDDIDKRSSEDKSCVSFTKTKSLKEAKNLLQFGYPAGLKKIDKLASQFLSETLNKYKITRSYMFDVVGDCFMYERYQQRKPDCFFKIIKENKKAPVRLVRILIDAGFSGNKQEPEIYRRGAIICALVKLLQLANISTEIVAYTQSRSRHINNNENSHTYTETFNIKSQREPLDMDKLAFTFCHPSFLRRITFALQERESVEVVERHGFKASEGYGYVGAPSKKEIESFDMYIPSLNKIPFKDDESAQENLLKWSDTLGLKLTKR